MSHGIKIYTCLISALSFIGCGPTGTAVKSSESHSENRNESAVQSLALSGLEVSRGDTHFIWLGPREMDAEYYGNIARWMEGRGKNGATLWVDTESASHINRALLDSPQSRLKALKIRHIAEMYQDALAVAPAFKDQLEIVKLTEELDGIGRSNPAARSDLLRLLALFTYGGLYTDVDNSYDPQIRFRRSRLMADLPGPGLHVPHFPGVARSNNSVLFIDQPLDHNTMVILAGAAQKRLSMMDFVAPSSKAIGKAYAQELADSLENPGDDAPNSQSILAAIAARTDLNARQKAKILRFLASELTGLEDDIRDGTLARGIRRVGSPVDVRGSDRILGTMYTTGPVHLGSYRSDTGESDVIRAIPGTLSYGAVLRVTLPGGVPMTDGQHAAWAEQGDGLFYAKAEQAKRSGAPKRRAYSLPPSRPTR